MNSAVDKAVVVSPAKIGCFPFLDEQLMHLYRDNSGEVTINYQELEKGITGQDNHWSVTIGPEGEFKGATVKLEYPDTMGYDHPDTDFLPEEMNIEFKGRPFDNPMVQKIYIAAVEFLDSSNDPDWKPFAKAKTAAIKIKEEVRMLNKESERLRSENDILRRLITDVQSATIKLEETVLIAQKKISEMRT